MARKKCVKSRRRRAPRLQRTRLDLEKKSPIAKSFLEFASSRIVGQERIIRFAITALERMEVDFSEQRKPVASSLLLGPSGVGKTLIAKTLAEFLFDDPDGFFRIDGPDYSQRH